MEASAARPRSIVGPAILIVIGVLFLGSNLGLIDRAAWQSIAQCWPLILVAIGIDMMVRKSTFSGVGAAISALLAMLVVLVVGAAVLFASPHVTLGERGLMVTTARSSAPVIRIGGPVHGESFSQPLDGAERAAVELNLGVGQMSVGAMTEATGLIEGTVMLGEDERVTQDYHVGGSTGYFKLAGHQPSVVHNGGLFDGDGRKWDLRLNPDVPTNLTVNIGVGTTHMDLSRLRLTSLQVHGGVGDTDVALPQKGQYHATVDGGVGKTVILVPRGLPARIEVDRGLAGVEVDGDYRQNGRVYTSGGYDRAQDRVEMVVRGGVGKVTIREY